MGLHQRRLFPAADQCAINRKSLRSQPPLNDRAEYRQGEPRALRAARAACHPSREVKGHYLGQCAAVSGRRCRDSSNLAADMKQGDAFFCPGRQLVPATPGVPDRTGRRCEDAQLRRAAADLPQRRRTADITSEKTDCC